MRFQERNNIMTISPVFQAVAASKSMPCRSSVRAKAGPRAPSAYAFQATAGHARSVKYAAGAQSIFPNHNMKSRGFGDVIGLILILTLFVSPFGLLAQEYDQTLHTLEANPDVEAQVKGNYPPLIRAESLPLGSIQHAWDKSKNSAGVYTLNFNPREIIRLRLREYMTTTISLPFWESIESYVLGDEGSYFVKKVNGNTLNIRSHGLIGTDTTLTVYGRSGQIYGIYLRAEGYNSKHTSDIIVHVQAARPLVRTETYQKDSSNADDFIDPVQSNPGELNFNYTMAGNADIAPDRVYTDGQKTWFDYGRRIRSADLPIIHNIVDGVDTPINVIREGTKLVAFGTGSFSLKHGKRITCVYPTTPYVFQAVAASGSPSRSSRSAKYAAGAQSILPSHIMKSAGYQEE